MQAHSNNQPPHRLDRIRNWLRHTKIRADQVNLPWIYNDQAELLFPVEISGSARIRYHDGVRIIDWELDKWISYEKDGAKWYRVPLSDNDYEVLYGLLEPLIRSILNNI